MAGFDDFVALFASGIDGLWSTTMAEVLIVAGPETYRLSATTFRDRIIDTANRGGVSSRRYLVSQITRGSTPPAGGRIQTDARQGRQRPAGDHVQKGEVANAVADADCGLPGLVWQQFSIDDIYSAARRRANATSPCRFMLGDVILVQPDAFEQVAIRVSV